MRAGSDRVLIVAGSYVDGVFAGVWARYYYNWSDSRWFYSFRAAGYAS